MIQKESQMKYDLIKAVNSIASLLDNGQMTLHNEEMTVVAEKFIRTFKKQHVQAYDICVKKCSFLCVK